MVELCGGSLGIRFGVVSGVASIAASGGEAPPPELINWTTGICWIVVGVVFDMVVVLVLLPRADEDPDCWSRAGGGVVKIILLGVQKFSFNLNKDEGGGFETIEDVLISSRCKVVNSQVVVEVLGQVFFGPPLSSHWFPFPSPDLPPSMAYLAQSAITSCASIFRHL